MRQEQIAEVRIDDLHRLFLRPVETTFDKIYRAAMGVDWDEEAQALVGPAPREIGHSRWFEHILAAAADEYGVALTLGPHTVWTNVSPDVRRDMEAFARSDWVVKFTAARAATDKAHWHHHQLQQALSDAAPYWESGQYAEYARTLAPIRELLSPAQLKRLAIAERRART